MEPRVRDFGELVERPGIIPAAYLAGAMWVQEQELGGTLDRRELERLVCASYALVKAKLPKRRFRETSALGRKPAPNRRASRGRAKR